MKKNIACFGVALLMIAASGCMTSAQSGAMVATTPLAMSKKPYAVAVAVSGTTEASKLGGSQISNAAFSQAIRKSIENSGLFTKAYSEPGTRYQLAALIDEIEQPEFGHSMTVNMKVAYTLTDTQARRPVWSRHIASAYTAEAGDAILDVQRLRVATEGAARENIRMMLEALAPVELK